MPLIRQPIPGLAAAVRREKTIRDNAFIDGNERIAGIEVLPLTMERLGILDRVKSPFTVGGRIPDENDVAIFLWIVSPQFRPMENLFDRLAHWRFIRSTAKLKLGIGIKEITTYLQRYFLDGPGGSESGKSYFSWRAVVVATIAEKFGWDEHKIERIPLTRIWQYLRVIRVMEDPKAVLINRESDSCIAYYLELLGKIHAAKAKAQTETENPS